MTVTETLTETVKAAVGLDGSSGTVATREQMAEAKLPLAYRDSCAHLLIPLNRCRRKEWYLPWKCEDERHGYEKCQFTEYMRRVEKQKELKEARGGARSN